jgi:hypothetical protein
MKKLSQRFLLQMVLVFIMVGMGIPSVAHAAILFQEYFTGLTPGAAITTGNTDFDYVRVGGGGGSITSERTVGGEDYLRLGGTATGALNGVGLRGDGATNLGGATVVTMNFRLNLESTAGTLLLGMGTGNMFTGNSTFTTADLMWAIQSTNGALQYRTGSWNAFAPAVALVADQNYEFHIIANRSGANVTYDAGNQTITTGRMHVYLDGTLIGDVPIANNQNANGFRFYQINNGLYANIDSITISDEALDPFTPTAVTLARTGANTAALPSLPFAFAFLMLAVASFVVGRRKA